MCKYLGQHEKTIESESSSEKNKESQETNLLSRQNSISQQLLPLLFGGSCISASDEQFARCTELRSSSPPLVTVAQGSHGLHAHVSRLVLVAGSIHPLCSSASTRFQL